MALAWRRWLVWLDLPSALVLRLVVSARLRALRLPRLLVSGLLLLWLLPPLLVLARLLLR